MGINAIVDFLCENNCTVAFSKTEGAPRIEVIVTFPSYNGELVQVRSVGATLEAAMNKVPATVERKKKRPSWKHR